VDMLSSAPDVVVNNGAMMYFLSGNQTGVTASINAATGVFSSNGATGVTKTCTTYPTVVGGIVVGC
jgi:hypothetical protein